MASAGSPVYLPYLMNFMPCPAASTSWLIELAPRRPPRKIPLALFRWLRFLGVESAFFAAPNAPMGPQAFQNHFRGRRSCTQIFAVRNAELADVLHQALNFRELLVTVLSRCDIPQFQLASQFEPLNGRLEVHIREIFAEQPPDRRSNQLARNGVRAFQFAF